MALIIMIPVLMIVASDGWQLSDNMFLLITLLLCYLNYKDAKDKETADLYGGY